MIEVGPERTPTNSPRFFSETFSIAFSSKVFFTTLKLTPPLKHLLLSSLILSTVNSDVSARYRTPTSFSSAVKVSMYCAFSSLFIIKNFKRQQISHQFRSEERRVG